MRLLENGFVPLASVALSCLKDGFSYITNIPPPNGLIAVSDECTK